VVPARNCTTTSVVQPSIVTVWAMKEIGSKCVEMLTWFRIGVW